MDKNTQTWLEKGVQISFYLSKEKERRQTPTPAACILRSYTYFSLKIASKNVSSSTILHTDGYQIALANMLEHPSHKKAYPNLSQLGQQSNSIKHNPTMQ